MNGPCNFAPQPLLKRKTLCRYVLRQRRSNSCARSGGDLLLGLFVTQKLCPSICCQVSLRSMHIVVTAERGWQLELTLQCLIHTVADFLGTFELSVMGAILHL